uniref:Malonyl-CoA:ACP transacylase (MAT) domain-containing protein n=1 Tax=Timema cristinae TaxID=61476 RepID=A0A7R9CQV5_TIMCR|nr:unnamed protein product [Timema cristinae]
MVYIEHDSIRNKDVGKYYATAGLGYTDLKDMCPPEIDIACHNSSISCTISGPKEIVKHFVNELQEKNIFARAVNVANIAYHSRYIKPAAPKLLGYLKQLTSLKIYSAGLLPKVSNLYPPVQYPVSRGTASLSSLVTWDHHDNWKTALDVDTRKLGKLSSIVDQHTTISLNQEQFRMLEEHKIAGKVILPLSFILNWARLFEDFSDFFPLLDGEGQHIGLDHFSPTKRLLKIREILSIELKNTFQQNEKRLFCYRQVDRQSGPEVVLGAGILVGNFSPSVAAPRYYFCGPSFHQGKVDNVDPVNQYFLSVPREFRVSKSHG